MQHFKKSRKILEMFVANTFAYYFKVLYRHQWFHEETFNILYCTKCVL